MGKYRRKIKPVEQGLKNAAEEERARATEAVRASEEQKQENKAKTVAAIVFYTRRSCSSFFRSSFSG